MIYREIDLTAEFKNLEKDTSGNPVLTAYIPDNYEAIDINRKRPTVLIFPGGGYRSRSRREAEPVAIAYMGKGFNAFILEYSVYPECKHPRPLLQAAAAMAYIRKNADEFHVDPEAIAVVGFSAGGHLAGTISTLWKEEIVSETLGIEARDARPDASVLAYAVLVNKYAHQPSFDRVSDGDEEIADYLSIHKHVDADTPPTYLFATADEATVNPKSTLLTALALQEHGVSYEMHIYKSGRHGYSLGTYVTTRPDAEDLKKRIDPHVAGWFDESVHFLKELFAKNNI